MQAGCICSLTEASSGSQRGPTLRSRARDDVSIHDDSIAYDELADWCGSLHTKAKYQREGVALDVADNPIDLLRTHVAIVDHFRTLALPLPPRRLRLSLGRRGAYQLERWPDTDGKWNETGVPSQLNHEESKNVGNEVKVSKFKAQKRVSPSLAIGSLGSAFRHTTLHSA
ncbi:hypothetical protein C4D60_Mb07t08050 [Musa balbisiana]|uniref:Uncharacterized protein n=1 Tax=Musa balbisiana TaxID=52838 RepID=A0A4S8JFM9_MUSBA|nr:hypothetical protein C4D60_Mb07t08050 [Musa balbisiana]